MLGPDLSSQGDQTKLDSSDDSGIRDSNNGDVAM